MGSNFCVLPLTIIGNCWRKKKMSRKTIVFRVMEIIVGRRFLGVGVALIRSPCSVRNTGRIFYKTMSMKALVTEEFGDSSKLKYTDVPKPEPAEGEVKIFRMN